MVVYDRWKYPKRDSIFIVIYIPIDYKSVDLEINKLTSHDDEREPGVDAVFDGIGGKSLSSSYEILRSGGRLIAYGHLLQTSNIG